MDNFTPLNVAEPKKKKKLSKFLLIANIFLMVFVVGLTGYYLRNQYLETQKPKADGTTQCDDTCEPGKYDPNTGKTCVHSGIGGINCQHWTVCEDPTGKNNAWCIGTSHSGGWKPPPCPDGTALTCGNPNEDGNYDNSTHKGTQYIGKSFVCMPYKKCGDENFPSYTLYDTRCTGDYGDAMCHWNCMCCPPGKQRSCTLGDQYTYKQTITKDEVGWTKLTACKNRDDTFIKHELLPVPGFPDADCRELGTCAYETTCIQKTCTCQGVTVTNTPTPTRTLTPSPTRTPTPSPTRTPTPSPTPLISNTPTPSPTRTPTPSPTPIISNTPSPTPLISNTPSPTPIISNTPSPTPASLLCGTKSCDNATNPCQSGFSCLQANDGSNYCMMPEYATACKANPTYSNCCTAPGAPSPTPTEIVLAQVSPSPTTVAALLQTGVAKSFMYFIPTVIILLGLLL